MDKAEVPEYDSWRIEIPWLPPSLNVWKRSHWSETDRLLQAAGFLLKPYLRVVLDDLGIKEGPLPWKAEITFQVFSPRMRDEDNATIVGRKICIDAMRKLSFLRQDTPPYLHSIELPNQVDPQHPRTVITIRRFVDE